MKKLFSSNFFLVIAALMVFLFFLPHLAAGKIPIAGDALLGLYHPWRDVSYGGFNEGKYQVKNPLVTDPILQTYPWRKVAIDNLKQGKLSLWNPYSFSGQPLLANPQSSPFQIFNVFFLILPFKVAWGLQIILPLLFGAFFMALFLRSLNLSREAVVFGSLMLPISGFFVAWGQWGTVVTSAIWLPLILYTVNQIFIKINPFYFLLLVFAASQSIFSGHIQTSIYVFLASIMFVIFLFLKSRKFTPVAICLLGVALGIAVSAVQIMPTLEFAKLSARSLDQSYSQGRQDWFLPIQNLIQLFAPDFFGNPTTYNYWGVWNYGEFVSFIGVTATGFAILGILAKRKEIGFFIFLLVLSLFLALENPISKIPYTQNFPLISSMQPSRIIFLAIFSLCVICAYGFEVFLSSKGKIKWLFSPILILGIIFLLIITSRVFDNIFPLSGQISTAQVAFRNLILPAFIALALMVIFVARLLNFPKKLIIMAVFLLTAFELFRFANKFLPFTKTELVFPETKTTTFLENQQRPFRVLVTDRRIFGGNTLSVYGVETVQGYDPLYLGDYARLVSSWNEDKPAEAGDFNRIITPQNYNSKIADLLNVGYIVTFDDISEDGVLKVFEEGQTKIFKNENALNRAFFVDEIIKVESKDAELARLFDKEADYASVAFTSQIDFPGNQDKNMGNINFESYSDQDFVLRIDSSEQSPLVVSNIYYPGWRAFINGEEVPIYRVNYLLQAIIVPQGKSLVKFKFLPRLFYNGLYLSSAALIVTILAVFLLW